MTKTALVTGGAQGIGKAISSYFLNKGLQVVSADHDEEALSAAEKEFDSKQLLCLKVDVSVEAEIKKAVDKTIEWRGKINYLINNAGVTEFGPIEDFSLNQWLKVINTNLTSVFLLSKYCSPYLKVSNGRIVNIASTRALMCEKDNEAYAASKGGIISLTQALANSLSPNVLVNCISPGWISTSEWQKPSKRSTSSYSKEDHEQHLSGRIGKPEDVAELAFFLCDQQGGFITGQNFVIDGGMTKKMIYV